MVHLYRELSLPGSCPSGSRRNIKQLDIPIPVRRHYMVLVHFRPCQIKESVLGVEHCLGLDRALGGQVQDVEAPVSDQPKVGSRGNCDFGVKEGRVLDGVAVEPLRLE